MFSLTFVAALLSASFYGTAAALNCAVCPSSIFFQGQTRTLTFTLPSATSMQCNFGSPPISGLSPYCLFRNSDGQVILTNTGPIPAVSLPGACPSFAQVVSKSQC